MRPGGKCLRLITVSDRWEESRTESYDVLLHGPNTINTTSAPPLPPPQDDCDDAGEDDEYDTRGNASKSGQ